MNVKTLFGAKRMTRKEFWAESDRLLKEAQGFLAESQRLREETREITAENRRLLDELEQRLLCGKN